MDPFRATTQVSSLWHLTSVSRRIFYRFGTVTPEDPAGTAVVGVAGVGGLIWSTWYQRAEARRERNEARRSDLYVDLLLEIKQIRAGQASSRDDVFGARLEAYASRRVQDLYNDYILAHLKKEMNEDPLIDEMLGDARGDARDALVEQVRRELQVYD